MLSLSLIYFRQPPAAAGHHRRRRKTFSASFPAKTKNISYQPIYQIHYNTRRHALLLRPHSTAATATQHHPTYAVTTAATATLSTSSSSPLRYHFHRAPPPQIHQPPRPPHKGASGLIIAPRVRFGLIFRTRVRVSTTRVRWVHGSSNIRPKRDAFSVVINSTGAVGLDLAPQVRLVGLGKRIRECLGEQKAYKGAFGIAASH
nr:hypothetical protein [Tanacetum cinerariifolium]